jgi:peptidoglycan-associated lipoprotein
MKRTIQTTLIFAALVALGACTSGSKLDTPAGPVDNSTATPSAGPGRGVTTVTPTETGIDRETAALMDKSVYFDYDSYAVKDEYRGTVDANSKFLSSHRNRKVIVQGNTDERGGSEYNLALGQKRAEAVKKQLALLGVPEGQIEAVSLGKEKARNAGHDEAAWAENRRADFVYQVGQ